MNKLNVNDKVYFAEEKRPYTVKPVMKDLLFAQNHLIQGTLYYILLLTLKKK